MRSALPQSDEHNSVALSEQCSMLDADQLSQLLQIVRDFDQFTQDNDPYGEHDFGQVTLGGRYYYFKIDYYNLTLDQLSDNPADPALTHRVLTLMHTSEY